LLCPRRWPSPAAENERTEEREDERDRERFFPSACCPREAIRRGKEKKKRKEKKNGKREKDREKNKNELFVY
jgi:hypothetical protein